MDKKEKNIIHKISVHLTGRLVCGNCSLAKQTILTYGMEIWMDTILKASVLLILGALLGKISEVTLALLTFCIARTFAGGYHADSTGKCFVLTTGIIMGSVYAPQIFFQYPKWMFLCVALIYLVYAPNFVHECQNTTAQKKKCHCLIIILLIIAGCIPSYWQSIILTALLFEGVTLIRKVERM